MNAILENRSDPILSRLLRDPIMIRALFFQFEQGNHRVKRAKRYGSAQEPQTLNP